MEWLELPDQGDAERNRRGRVLVGAVGLALVVGVSGSALVSWMSADPTGVVVSTLGLVTTSAITLGLLRARRLELASHLFVASLWLAGLATMAQYGGVGGFGANAVVTSVIAAALLLPCSSTLVLIAASTVAFALFAAFDLELVRDPPPGRVEEFFVAFTGLAITAAFLFLSVTSLQSALREAQSARQRLEALIDASPDAIVTLDEQGGVHTANAALERLLGVEEDALLGRAFSDVARGFPAELPVSPRAIVRQGKALFEWTLHHRDGRPIPVEVHARPEGTSPIVVQLVVRDISHRLAAEQVKEAVGIRLRESRRLESLGQLAGGVAHDFNNVLTAILSYAELTRERDDVPPEVQSNMDVITQAGTRAARLTKQLLAFARRQVLEPRVIEVNGTISTVQGLLRQLLPQSLRLDLRLGDPQHVNVDPAQLEQVVVNLVVNARDAMPHGGRIMVETDAVALGDADVALHSDVEAGRYVRIAIADTGYGMDEETVSRVFEPFFTTKGQVTGTGLGLATVHGIVKQSGGHITVDSEVGRGTTFEVYLPAVEAPAEPKSVPKSPDPRPVAEEETVLAVDDDALVLKTTVKMLTRMGYRVLQATNGAEALEVLAANAAIRLVVSDVVMPGMSGPELAVQARKVRRGLRFLLMSGYTEAAIADEVTLDDSVSFISKPFTPATLDARVRAALDDRPADHGA